MRAVLANVQARTEAETPYGGRTVAWAQVATVWVEIRPAAPAEAAAPSGERPARRETAEGRARSHPALAAGVQLDAGDGPPWTVTAANPDDPAPGHVRLLLDRLL